MAFSLARYGLRVTGAILERNLLASSSLLLNSDPQIKVANSRVPSFRYNVMISPTRTLVMSAQKYSKKSKHDREYNSDSDSDDDLDHHHHKHHHHSHVKKPERGNTEFWRRKMRTLHGILDVNNDGVISFDDFMLLAKTFADLGNLQPAAHEEFKEVMTQTWEQQWGEITPYNLVTAEQFLADMHHALNDRDLKKKIHRFLPFIFKAVDKDRSGFIQLDQFKLFFICLGLTEEDAAVSFAVIDENGDGQLSIKEFVKLGRDYFLTEDEKRVSRMFWGPLVSH